MCPVARWRGRGVDVALAACLALSKVRNLGHLFTGRLVVAHHCAGFPCQGWSAWLGVVGLIGLANKTTLQGNHLDPSNTAPSDTSLPASSLSGAKSQISAFPSPSPI